MSIKITIPNSSSDVLTFGSGNTPTAAQIAGIDSGSSNGQLALYTTASGTSTERVRVDASGNVGIGTSSPAQKLHLASAGGTYMQVQNTTASIISYFGTTATGGVAQVSGAYPFSIFTNGSERLTVDSSGNLLVGTTTAGGIGNTLYKFANGTYAVSNTSSTSLNHYIFQYNSTTVGTISTTTTATSYVTSSDYRLKENVAPMTGALGIVAQLKPVTYSWKVDGSDGQGFIAHELAEVVPDAVVGEKDAVETYTDADGNEQTRPKYQGIDTSFLVATLTAAIKEQQAIIQTLTDRITALEGATS